MRAPRACLCLLLVSSTSVACATQEDVADRCGRLRDHVVELRVQAVPDGDRAAHVSALASALGDQFVAECKNISGKQRDCALAARDTASIVSCLAPAPPQ